MDKKKVVEIKGLVKNYGTRGFQTRVLKGIDLTIYENDFIAIMGPSGSGKTTLLNILSTIDKPTQGTVLLDGKDVTKLKNKELSQIRRDKIGFIFQDYNLLDTMTLQDNISLPLSLNGVSSQECISKCQALAQVFGLKEHLKKYPYQLSGGQKQRVAIAGVIAMHPKCIVLDEPTAMLDPCGRKEVIRTVEELRKREHVTVILITHYMEEVVGADRVIVMDKGHVVMEGTPRSIFSRVEELKKYL